MKIVNIAELKNHLGHYLRIVRRGAPLLVRDRDRVIARIEPVRDPSRIEDDEDRRLEDLELRGIVRRGKGKLTPQVLAARPRTKADVVRALLEEREGGR